jgi:hypothetical protein
MGSEELNREPWIIPGNLSNIAVMPFLTLTEVK